MARSKLTERELLLRYTYLLRFRQAYLRGVFEKSMRSLERAGCSDSWKKLKIDKKLLAKLDRPPGDMIVLASQAAAIAKRAMRCVNFGDMVLYDAVVARYDNALHDRTHRPPSRLRNSPLGAQPPR